jgi:Tfp pilus assembly protein PilX
MRGKPALKSQTPVGPQSGFALIIVIWLTVLLSIMAAAFTSAVNGRLRTAAAKRDVAQAEALAEAGTRMALLDLLTRPSDTSQPARFVPGAAVICRAGPDEALVILVRDEDGKVNLNTRNGKLLEALMRGLGASAADARGYTAKIMDFRDFDHDRRPDGAERDDYAKEPGSHLPPKDGDFASVDELAQVFGLPTDLVARMTPYVTTVSNLDGLDPAVAEPELVATLRKGGEGGFAASEAPDGIGSTPNVALPGFKAVSSRRNYSIHAEATLSSGTRYAAETLVALGVGGNGSPSFRQWRRALQPLMTFPPKAAGLPPC